MPAVVTLFLVMDPIGNVPLFLTVLRTVDPSRRPTILLRERGLRANQGLNRARQRS